MPDERGAPPDTGRTFGRALILASLATATVALSACVSTAPAPAAVREWHAARQTFAYRPAGVVFAGIAVTEFPWPRGNLRSWARSRDLLGAALARWLHVPEPRRLTLDNPDRATLQRFLTRELAAAAGPDDVVLIYLGTHQLRDGRILLAGGDSCRASDLAAWLDTLPQRQVLLADLCYAAQLETAAWPPRTLRVYAADVNELAPELRLHDTRPGVSGFFATTNHLVRTELRQDAERFSLFGYLLVHSLYRSLAPAPATLTTAAWWQTLLAEHGRLAQCAPLLDNPTPRVANLQDWPLASRTRQPAAPAAASDAPPSRAPALPAPAAGTRD